jgi:uncharacterized membrane protein YdbT with pleckstrin-like domain
MPFPQRLLLEDEELVFDLKPHWIAIVPAVLLGLLSIVAGWALIHYAFNGDWDTKHTVVLVAVLVSLLAFTVGPILRWMFTRFVLTSDRLVTRRGVIAKQSKEIPLERINDVSFSQTIFERMVGAGDLLVESAGERGQERISDVRKPESVQMRIYRVMEDNSNRMMRPAASAQPAQPEESITDQLEALGRLRAAGTISEAEFQTKKTELLKRM